MEVNDNSMESLHCAKQLLEGQKTNQVFEFPSENELTDISDRLIRFMDFKSSMKEKHLSEEGKLMFYKYLLQDPETWPTQQETEKQCKETKERHKQIKDKTEEEKTQIEALLEIADEGHSLLQKNIEDLEVKIKETEEKIRRAENVKKQYEEKISALGDSFPYNESVEQIKLTKKTLIDKLGTEIQKGKLSIETLSTQIQNDRDLLHTLSNRIRQHREDKTIIHKQNQVQNFLAKEEAANLKKLLEVMQRLSGIEECPAEYNQIKIKFVNASQHGSQLYLTMTLYQDSDGHVKLQNAEVNIPTLHCTDLIEHAVKTNDVRSLITQLRDRWNTYYPIMTEIDQVSESHAVDWIQDEGLVRVLVGKGGTVMFTLKMPSGYPFTGDITVANASGLPSYMSLEDSMPPLGARRLQDWVDHLEEKLGKP